MLRHILKPLIDLTYFFKMNLVVASYLEAIDRFDLIIQEECVCFIIS